MQPCKMYMCKIQMSVAWKTSAAQAPPLTPFRVSVSLFCRPSARGGWLRVPPLSVLAQDSRLSWSGRQPAPLGCCLGASWSGAQALCCSWAALTILRTFTSLPELLLCAQTGRSIFELLEEMSLEESGHSSHGNLILFQKLYLGSAPSHHRNLFLVSLCYPGEVTLHHLLPS